MASPLTFVDLFGVPHVEPSVTGLVEVQVAEPIAQSNVNDLIIISPFRSGKPLTIKRFTNLTALADNHDPDRTGDEGVAIARAARAPFGDQNVFGAANIMTLRPEGATQAGTIVSSEPSQVVDLFQVLTGDYGSHTNNRVLVIEDGSQVGKKIILSDNSNSARRFEGDNLGVLIDSIEYTGNATGTVGLRLVQPTYVLSYAVALPGDADTITVVIGQTRRVFEFDSASPVLTDSDNIPVSLAGTANVTFKRFANLIAGYFPSLSVEFDESAATIKLVGAGTLTLTPSSGASGFTVSGSTISYTANPAAADTLTIVAGGKSLVFEFVSAVQTYVDGNIPVVIGATSDDAAGNLRRAIAQAFDAIYDSVTHDSSSREIRIVASEFGVRAASGSAQYTATAEGNPSRLQVRFTETVLYDGGSNAVDGDTFTVNGIVFEFDAGTGVTSGNVAVQIGAAANDTALNLTNAINNVFQSSVVAVLDTVISSIYLSSISVAINTGTSGAWILSAPSGATDGSRPWDLALTLGSYSTLGKLVGFFNQQQGYVATINSFADKFLASTGIDSFFPAGTTLLSDGSADIKSPNSVTLTGYVASIVEWINRRTRGNYDASEIARGIPANGVYTFAGGGTPGITFNDWSNAFDVLDAVIEEGAILLLNTDDPVVMRMTATFIEEQRSRGKWFRAYFGMAPGLASGDDVSTYLNIASSIDHSRIRLVMQRPGVFRSDNTIEYLHPVFLAAALAGGASGNLPYKQTLTNKRLRFAGVHPDDEFSLDVREQLLAGGITVIKKEQNLLYVSLNVTSSQDPNKRMVRIVSEIDTVDLMDARMRKAFLAFRGRWANADVSARVILVRQIVLNEFVRDGAIADGVSEQGEVIPAWSVKSVGPNGEGHVIYAGVLRVGWQAYIPGELNHVSIIGNVEYQRLVGAISGGVADQVTTVPIR